MIRCDLTGRSALVTGGSRGIGAAIARRLGACGAAVTVGYVSRADEADAVVAAIRAAGGTAEAAPGDVADDAAAKALVDGVLARHGRIDIVVNNAGILKDGLLLTMRPEHWRRVQAVDVDGVYHVTRHALGAMFPASRGTIVNVASVAAIRGGRGQVNYAAAKGAVLSFTRALAMEVAERGIRVNAVLPGFMETDMTASLKRRAGAEILARIPVGRYGTAEDVAGMVVYLVSDDASYVTGQAFCVDGGMSVA
jgi:3-oxoacyl-[acyl-carrier protein] reductase